MSDKGSTFYNKISYFLLAINVSIENCLENMINVRRSVWLRSDYKMFSNVIKVLQAKRIERCKSSLSEAFNFKAELSRSANEATHEHCRNHES